MEINQWVFWGTAIPLTMLVITLCLWWTGELGGVGSWFGNFGSGRGRVSVGVRGGRTDEDEMMVRRDNVRWRERRRVSPDGFRDYGDERDFIPRAPPRLRGGREGDYAPPYLY